MKQNKANQKSKKQVSHGKMAKIISSNAQESE